MGDLGAQCDWLPLSGRVTRQNPSGPAIPRLCLVPALASSTACATWDRVSGLRLAGENVLQACHENGVHSLQHFLCSKTPGEHAISVPGQQKPLMKHQQCCILPCLEFCFRVSPFKSCVIAQCLDPPSVNLLHTMNPPCWFFKNGLLSGGPT